MSSARRAKPKRPPPSAPASGVAPQQRKRGVPPPLPKRSAAKRSDPEIRYEYGPAGRETLSAIADEVAGIARAIAVRPDNPSAPAISLSEGPAGRDTVAAIAREVAAHAPIASRPRLTTLDYASRPVDEPELALSPEPETAVRKRQPAGRETLDDIAELLGGLESKSAEDVEICEMATFVVRGKDLTQLSTEDGRRQFVETRLLARLPVASMAEVVRIDVTPWTVQGTLIVRVWCRLGD